MMAKILNPILLFGGAQRKKPDSLLERIRSAWHFRNSRLEDQAVGKPSAAQPDATSENPVSEIRKTINGSVVTFEGTYLGKPIRVRIFNETPREVIDT